MEKGTDRILGVHIIGKFFDFCHHLVYVLFYLAFFLATDSDYYNNEDTSDVTVPQEMWNNDDNGQITGNDEESGPSDIRCLLGPTATNDAHHYHHHRHSTSK
jgi:hypothetical protein